MSKFLNNITDAFILSSNLCNGKPCTLREFKNSVGYKLLFKFSLPSSLLTVSALYKFIIGVSSQNLLMATELIASQSQFFGVRKNLRYKSVWCIWHM